MTHFKNLLNRMLNGTATEAERSEFLDLVNTGKFDEELTGEDLEKLSELEFENEATREVYTRIEADQLEPTRKVVPFRRSSTWLAAAAIIVMAVVAGVWYIALEQQWFNHLSVSEQENDDWTTYTGKQVVDLPDGSRVVLNENSELKHKHSFGEAGREVTLVGEAVFDVTHDASRPFLVHTGQITTRVLGTEFNIQAYPGQSKVTVTVIRGLVQVGDEQRVYGQIKPNEQIAVNVNSREFVQQKTNAQSAVEWKSNFLILADVTLEEAAKIIGTKFDVQIKFENEALKKCRFDGRFFNNEDLEKVLSIMSTVMGISYTIEHNIVTLHGKECI